MLLKKGGTRSGARTPRASSKQGDFHLAPEPPGGRLLPFDLLVFEPVEGLPAPVAGDRHAPLGMADDDPGAGEPLALVELLEGPADRRAQRRDGGGERLGGGEPLLDLLE